jgi:hypothetical protein
MYDEIFKLIQADTARESAKKKRLLELYDLLKTGEAKMKLNGETDFSGWFLRLVDANDRWTEPNEDRASLWLGSGRGEAVAVGKEINAASGFGGMQAMYRMVEEYHPRFAARELSAAWSGIGDWLD